MVEYRETVLIPRRLIRPNEWNPNVMAADLFNEVNKNIEELGFVQDVIVAPLTKEQQGDSGYEYRIVDGEHRFDALGLLGMEIEIDGEMVEVVPCKVVDIPEDDQKFQTIKLNRLKGKMDLKKFNNLVRDLMQRHTFEEVAEKMAFTDPTELEGMITQTRDSLPPEMREEFDKAKGEIKTVDDLSLVLNRLFTQFGNTLPCNFMILDFGGKQHLWVRMEPRDYKMVVGKARECMAHGVTFDSVLSRVMVVLPVDKFICGHRDFLKAPEPESASKGNVFELDG
jgi:hypothetical protein